MTYLQASLFRVHHERPSGEQDAGVGMPQQSLGVRQLRTARLGKGSFPGQGSEPSILPLPYRPPRVEPATVLRHLAPFSEWVLAPRSSVGKTLLILWPLRPNSRIDILVSQRQHLQKWQLMALPGSNKSLLVSGACFLSRVNPWVLCAQAPLDRGLPACGQAKTGVCH